MGAGQSTRPACGRDGSHAKRSKLTAVLLPPVLNVANSEMADSPVFVQWNGTKSRPNLQNVFNRAVIFGEYYEKPREFCLWSVERKNS